MNNACVIAGLLMSLCTAVQADPCFGGTLASYINGPSCSFDDLTLSNFSYHASAAGGALVPDAGSIDINPEVIGGARGILFSADWSVGFGQMESSLIGFTVTCGNCMIGGVALILTGGSQSSGSASASETSLSPILSLTTGGLDLEDAATFSPVISIEVMKHIVLSGGSASDGHAQITTVSNLFSIVPEPSFNLLCLAASLLIVAVRHCRRV